MKLTSKVSPHMSIDYICHLQDYIEQLIEETHINIKSLSSFRAYPSFDGTIEFDYNSDEAYSIRLEKFKQELSCRGWYYIFCYGVKNAKKWQKATRNKKLYNRIKRLILNLIEEAF